MTFKINSREQEALRGLPHLQSLVYLLALRPYMDYSTGFVGLKRRVSYQSVSESLYVEPHQGYGSGSPSRDQIRRALKGLVRTELLVNHSGDKQLIFYCPKAMQDFSVQNKAATKPPYQATPKPHAVSEEKTSGYKPFHRQAALGDRAKAATPLVSGILLTHTQRAREKKNPSLSFAYTPSEAVLATARRLQCAGASPAQEPLERAKFISYHLARDTVRQDWDAEYLGWLLRTAASRNDRSASTRQTPLSSEGTSVARRGSSGQRPVSVGGAMDRVLEANRDLLDFFTENTGTKKSPVVRHPNNIVSHGGCNDYSE